MATLKALRRTGGPPMRAIDGPHGEPDAVGVVSAAPFDGNHLMIALCQDGKNTENDRDGWSTFEVTFDSANVTSMFNYEGHPGVVGLYISSYSSSLLVSGDNRSTVSSLKPFTAYVVANHSFYDGPW